MRLFIGLPLPKEVQQRLSDAKARVVQSPTGTRPIDPKNWHVTVAFLGRVNPIDLDALKTLFANATEHPPGGSFFIHEFRTFPPRHASYVVAHAVPERLLEWKTYILRLRDMVSLVAPQVDRKPWIPHISIERAVQHSALPQWSHPIDPIVWDVNTIALVESASTKDGSSYNDMYEIPINI